MSLYIELYLAFVRIGFASFGGASSIALILDEMQSHGWMTAQDLSNLVGIAEMTPGPLGLNCATFAGLQTGGMIGSLVAAAGVLTPCMTLTMMVAVFYQKFKTSDAMKWVMLVVKPICVGMLVKAVITLCSQNYFEGFTPQVLCILLGAVCFYLIYYKKWSVPKLILFAGAAGALVFGVGGMFLPI